MGKKRTYMELTEYVGESHKFFEVVVDGDTLETRYGRIGAEGTKTVKKFPSEEKALKEGDKKVAGKRKKGYADAVEGQRSRRAVVASKKDDDLPAPLPAQSLWVFQSEGKLDEAEAVYIESGGCWIGNNHGEVFELDHDGCQKRRMQLDATMVMSLVGDGGWVYALCRSGQCYEVRDAPTLAYEVPDKLGMRWMDINDGLLTATADDGTVQCYDHDDMSQTRWKSKSDGTALWTVRCDGDGVYVGDSAGIVAFGKDGKRLWTASTGEKGGEVLFGWQDRTSMFVGVRRASVLRFNKADGALLAEYKCSGKVVACAASQDGKRVFAADSDSLVYAFDSESAELQWRIKLRTGMAFAMQLWRDRLYVCTYTGFLECVDVSASAIAAARAGKSPECIPHEASREGKALVPVAKVENVPMANEADESKGIVLMCVKRHGKLRVVVDTGRPSGKGLNPEWNIQFPKSLRAEGQRYVVEKLSETAAGFYRCSGTIRKLE